MKPVKTHIVISTVLCALTLVMLFATRGYLPDQVPMQWGLTGEVSSYWPRDAGVCGVPVACVAINILVAARLAGKGEDRVAMYYITPVVALVATAVIVFLGMR